MEWFIGLDRALFYFINTTMSWAPLDAVMPVITDLHKQPLFWVALLLLIVGTIARADDKKLKAKRWGIGLLIVGLSIGFADLTAYRGIKIWVQRDRPEAAGEPVILRSNSHSGWSFPSNHATNNFAMARAVQILVPQYAIPAYAVAATIAFSRVYVGVHYPSDTLAGGLIGWICASLIGLGYRRLLRKKP